MGQRMTRGGGTEPLLTVAGVESITLRAVAGDGDQVELWVKTARDDLTVRLLPRRGRAIRVTDLRRRDKRLTPRVTVPFLNGTED